MSIKDIVNRDLVTLTNCDQEPIHIPGKIQPHGFLMGLTNNWTIDYCTDNISIFIDISHAQALGNKFETIFGTAAQEQIFNYIHSDTAQDVFPLEIVLLDKRFQVTIHKSDDIYVLEAEIQFDKQILADVYTQTIQFVAQMNSTKSLKDLCALVAAGTREITGYDRVMIYRFDEQYNGEVYAESCRKDLEPFLGLHYPHTDIPVQARELYIKNELRLIVDINYQAVPIYTVDDKADKNLDLSLSILRSTSPIHVQYLKNMGVGATLTISLIHHGRLWGLIACHHYSQKNISPAVRLAAKLQGQFITSQIDIRESNDENSNAKSSVEALENLMALDLPLIEDSLKTIVKMPELLKLCNSVGVSIVFRNKIYKNGLTPVDDQIKGFIEQIESKNYGEFFITRKIKDHFPELENCSDFAGVIYHSLGNSNHIIWFRAETISEINWAGDPEKSIVKDEKGLHPRNSFNIWKQIVKGQSSIWRQYEINSAAKFAHALQKNLMMILLSEEEERYRLQSEVLRETNSELENINWISTHDLQEPLRKIQMITSKLLSEKKSDPQHPDLNPLERVSNSASRMRELLQDILKYTRIKNTREAAEIVDLNEIYAAVVDEISESILEKNAVIECEKLPEVNAIGFLMRQLFLNIIQNSLKYAAAERTPVIRITASQEPVIVKHLSNKYCNWVRFSDNGIGFEQQYSDSIFKVFTRLHTQQHYSGSGIGLALCKKIMQSLGGAIYAEGVEGEGACITIYFPCDPADTLI
ncbi:ATP-binding protein [Flavobacterium limi]|uniref:histidine kinase n=1 Tax=Flavobacterium limi TaxID=2045105 RepID=A0ABQ1UZ97_9FLAO|nr:ATP-binding protein [Flavobacterium limi]GGF29536.1 histidine kinase [Flavobacterium limi]